MAHSKRNTSRPVFTSHERAIAQAAWSSSSARLNRESFLPFASCSLCLEPARDPVACPHGDMFCRECALNNILAQKQEIKRLEKLREQQDREETKVHQKRDAEAKERAILEFERTQQGLDLKATASTATSLQPAKDSTKDFAPTSAGNPPPISKREGKRKFELDDEEVLRIAREDRAKARKALDDETAKKPVLPSFWVPAVTPTSNKDVLHQLKRKARRHPVCPSSREENPHNYSFHNLIPINFAEEEDSVSKKKQWICPACQKALSNSSKAVVAKPCGHVLCKSCVNTFMKPEGNADPQSPGLGLSLVRCYVCDKNLGEKNGREGKRKDKIHPGLVDLRSEGTGFSAGGTTQVKKSGVGFQC